MARSFSRTTDTPTYWRVIVHLGALLPAAILVLRIVTGSLGVDPIGQAIRLSGRYALSMLFVALLPGPMARLGGLRQSLKFRRPLGLYAFGYALLHFLLFAGWDYRFQVNYLVQTIVRSPFIWAGLAALMILLILAATSNRWSMRRLGKSWRRLHRFVLLASVLAALHYAWVFKELRIWPVMAGLTAILLIVVRIPKVEQLIQQWWRSDLRRGTGSS